MKGALLLDPIPPLGGVEPLFALLLVVAMGFVFLVFKLFFP
jgi:hypothetical protein